MIQNVHDKIQPRDLTHPDPLEKKNASHAISFRHPQTLVAAATDTST